MGFKVTAQRYKTGGGSSSAVYDDVVTLLGLTGTLMDHSSGSPWSSGAMQVNYGYSTDLWGATAPTLAQVQDPGFGVELGCECTLLPGTGADVNLNSVSITVYFLPTGSPVASVNLVVYSAHTTALATATVRYSLDAGATWTTIRSSGLAWNAMTTPDTVSVPTTVHWNLIVVEAITASPGSSGVDVLEIGEIYLEAVL